MKLIVVNRTAQYAFGGLRAMDIVITSGTGTGPTSLAAFDNALLDSGVANYNLICLSSIVPPRAKMHRRTWVAESDDYGNRLYVVMARQHAIEKGAGAWAGLGWLQEAEDGRGLFVEGVGHSEPDVRNILDVTLTDMASRRGRKYGGPEFEVAGVKCHGTPVCAVVIAVFLSADWPDY